MRKPLGKRKPPPDVRDQLIRALDLETAGKLAEAEQLYGAVLELDPTNFAALNRRAIICSGRGEHVEALRLIQAAMRSNPKSGETASDMGAILERMGRLEEAKASYERALVLRPNQPVAHNGRGLALAAKGRNREAIAAFTRAIEINPGYADARFHRALAYLVVGDFAVGWDEYEWRWAVGKARTVRPDFPMPDWNGEPLAGKGIYLYIEQGFGDAIMFARYAPLVAARGATVLFCVRPPLKALLAGMPGVTVGVPGDRGPKCDYMCPLLSLPRILKTNIESIPADVPYIHAPPDRIEKWQGRIPRDGRLKVGIVWAGGRDFVADRWRTIGFERLAPLLGNPRVCYVSLHAELREDDAALMAAHPEIVQFGSELEDFADTAAVISQLDLVISVDTAVAHLAGAMAKPVWIMLPSAPDWRWLLGRDDSPWYPTARLFRQTKLGEWDGVIARVRDALAALTASVSPM
jgi:Tetratricopeptide repeat/Glycosyltransferase family 9 (heptosyltransferase)